MRRKWIVPVVCALLLLLAAAFRPPLIGGEELDEPQRAAVMSQAKGLYSERLPLVPLFVSVEKSSRDAVYYTVHYFPFGTVRMSWHAQDGYHIEKNLSGLS